jgi:hypothetical protein
MSDNKIQIPAHNFLGHSRKAILTTCRIPVVDLTSLRLDQAQFA